MGWVLGGGVWIVARHVLGLGRSYCPGGGGGAELSPLPPAPGGFLQATDPETHKAIGDGASFPSLLVFDQLPPRPDDQAFEARKQIFLQLAPWNWEGQKGTCAL